MAVQNRKCWIGNNAPPGMTRGDYDDEMNYLKHIKDDV